MVQADAVPSAQEEILPALGSQAPFAVPIAVGIVRRRSSLAIAASYALLAAAVGTVTGFVARPHGSGNASAPPAPPTTSNAIPDVPVPTLASPTTAITTTTSAEVAAPPVPTPATADTVPVMDVAKLPRARDGIVVGSPGHRLWIDGSLAPNWQVTVSCGPHVVQVGSAGAARTVDVPCGESIFATP